MPPEPPPRHRLEHLRRKLERHHADLTYGIDPELPGDVDFPAILLDDEYDDLLAALDAAIDHTYERKRK